jgi:hypothetical protein
VITDNPVQILLFHIGKGYIIPLQKGEPGIIIFKVQRIPHPLRHLVDKAEHTLVPAGFIFIHQTVFKDNTQILIVLFFNLKLPFFPVFFPNQYYNIFLTAQIMIVEYVFHIRVIDGEQHVPRLYFHFLCNAAGQNLADNMFFWHIFPLFPFHIVYTKTERITTLLTKIERTGQNITWPVLLSHDFYSSGSGACSISHWVISSSGLFIISISISA